MVFFDTIPIASSLIAAFAIYVTFWKLDIYKFLGYDILMDVLFSVALAWFYMGTFSGATSAMLAGLLLGVMLRTTRWLIGYKKLEFYDNKLIWRYYAE